MESKEPKEHYVESEDDSDGGFRKKTYRHVTNAFGDDCPPKNLPFSNGNLTAAEILAYRPHWLKSVDVVNRFLTNGATYSISATMINEFRDFSEGQALKSNPVLKMAQGSRGAAVNKKWSIGNHQEHFKDRVWDTTSLNTLICELFWFPLGCAHSSVNWCLEPPGHEYVFPSEFEKVLDLVGVPINVTALHHEKQAFVCRLNTAIGAISLRQSTSFLADPSPSSAQPHTQPTSMSRLNSRTRLAGLNGRSRHLVSDEEPSETDTDIQPNRRRSTRNTRTINYAESDEETAGYSTAASWTTEESLARRTRAATKGLFKPRQDKDQDGEWESDNQAYGFAASTFNPETGRFDKSKEQMNAEWHTWVHKHVLTDGLSPRNIHLPAQKPTLGNLKEDSSPPSPKTVAAAVRAYESRVPIYLKAPVLDPLRPAVDEHTIWLYSADGCKTEEERWESALSSTRFNGPRKHAPYRELYRLTEPDVKDTSDWAENIRWAKEQYREFGSKTWTEYDYHLETITQVRRNTNWVSEEALNSGL
ncbi:hypothetical protein DM02DRAFT_655793 [Periconia macrospinosa]|uniref:Uncharacterized protein n=1 Tax=Periconia macrospinosa TaxID=97972 RepID=A0A2V1DS45_9PLEO|nr:hypothetical protein DM02DRAFT_655793 [Periconia macrospinosa]